MTRIGVIGLGAWGQNVLKTLAALPGVEVAWTAGSRDWATKLAETVTGTVGGVAIAVPAPVQAQVACRAIDLGLSVFVEKPLALTRGDARRVRDRAAVMGVPVVVDHVHLFSAEYEVLHDALAGGMRLRYVETFAGGPGPFRPWEPATPYPALWDYGAHDAALLLDLVSACGVQSSLTATLARRSDRPGGDYIVRALWPALHGTLSFGNGRDRKTRVLYVGLDDGGQWKLDALAPVGERLRCEGGAVPVVGDAVPPLRRALETWLAAVRRERVDRRVGCDLAVRVTDFLASAQEYLQAHPPEGDA